MINSLADIAAITIRIFRTEQAGSAPQRTRDTAPGHNGDTVEVSAHTARLTNLQDVRDRRAERIRSAREQIAKHTYETESKVNTTVERLFAELAALDLRA